MLHHLFVQLVKQLSAVIAREVAFSVEFAVDSQSRTFSIGFWEGKQFVCLLIVLCGRYVSRTKGYFALMTRLLSAISSDATVIFCGGSDADFVKVLDKKLGRKAGLQYPFTLILLQFERLFDKPSFSVTGSIDMRSMLRSLLLRLKGLL